LARRNATQIDRAKLYRMDSLLLTSIFAALLMSAFFVVVLSAYYTKQVFDPLKRLGDIMHNFEQKDFNTNFKIPGNNEITVLVDQFNLMCKRFKMLHEQIYESEIRLRNAELAVLQSEINPHFFYNTLDTIYWMSEMSSTWKISEMVRSLSKLFRITLQKTAGGLVPLSVEQEYMNCYLAIQKVRYQDLISFEFYVQEGLDDIQVLKLLKDIKPSNFSFQDVFLNLARSIQVFSENSDLYTRLEALFNTGYTIETVRETIFSVTNSDYSRYGPQIRNTLNYMTKNCAADLSLADTAAELYISPSYLTRLLKNKTGRGFHEWLHIIRIGKAKELLEKSDLRYYEIAEQVGYSSYKIFSEYFAKIAGCSARSYRETLLCGSKRSSGVGIRKHSGDDTEEA
jgi:YesN/AraC family two-component response regulator